MKESIEQINKFKIDSISPEEWRQYKKLWLEALTTDPQAFGYSLTEISNRTEQEWQDIIKRNLDPENNRKIIAAKTNAEFIGMMGYFPENENTANIYGVYVKKEYRGKGVSAKIMEEILNSIAKNKKFTRIELGVNQNQSSAIGFYKHYGFQIIEEIKDVKMGDGKLYDEYLMRKIILIPSI